MNALIQSLRSLPRLSLSVEARRAPVVACAMTLVAYFYWVLPYVAYMTFMQDAVGGSLRPNFDPFWPLFWTTLTSLSYPDIVLAVRSFFLVAALIGALTYRHWAGRLLVFLAVWQVHAFESSFGTIDHPWYVLLFATFILVWLPDLWGKKREFPEARRIFLLLIWWAQASVMLIYTMSGFGKLLGVIYQISKGEIHGLSMHAFAYQIADWLPRIQHPAPLGPFFIEHGWIAWPIYLISFYFQLFALWTMVRPSLQRLWAFEMVLFHIGTYLIMGISFSPFIVVLILLFFNTPFGREAGWKEILFDLPIFGPLARWLYARVQPRSAPLSP